MKLAGAATAACAACCAVSIVPVVLAGTSLAAIGGAAATWGTWIGVLGVLTVGLYLLARRKADPNADFRSLVAAGDSCGCGSCDASFQDEEPIACTLGVSDFRERVDSIRNLARHSLIHASRTPLSLTLTYAPDAIGELRDLVRKEQECCAFLTFSLKESAIRVVLTITAPTSAAKAADVLFDHFAPELAASSPKESA
jgi:hypothetical protein